MAQTEEVHVSPQKGDNIIGIYSKDPLDVAIDKFGHALAMYDFKIEDVDPYKNVILSSWGYPFANNNFRMRIVGSYLEVPKEDKIIVIISLVGYVEQYRYYDQLIQTTKTFYCEYKENGTHVKNAGFTIMNEIAKYNGNYVQYQKRSIDP